MQQFFFKISDGESNVKFRRLNRPLFKSFLQQRYSDLVGERIMLFIESCYGSLYKIDFYSFLQIITDIINAGPEGYQKLVFACFGLSNPGLICEHDVFTILEEFKQQSSF